MFTVSFILTKQEDKGRACKNPDQKDVGVEDLYIHIEKARLQRFVPWAGRWGELKTLLSISVYHCNKIDPRVVKSFR